MAVAGDDSEVNDFPEARRSNAAATQMLRDVANGKLAAGAKAPDAGKVFEANARSKGYGPNAFDKAGGPRTTP